MDNVIAQWLADELTGWSMGSFGAICEFIRWPGDAPAQKADRGTGWHTPRGAIRIDTTAGVTLLAWDMPSTKSDRFFRHVELLLPEAQARVAQSEGLQEIGIDQDAIRAEDRDMVIFDCGLRQPNVRFCIRTRDPELLACLRANIGRDYFDPANTAAAMIFARHPHRIALTQIGRCEVFQKIGGPDTDWKSPDGPHTHLLPKLLAAKRTHSANAPIPQGWLPVASLHPASPFSLPDGTERPFCKATFRHYQALMERYRSDAARACRQALDAGAPAVAADARVIDADESEVPNSLGSTRFLRHVERVYQLERKFAAE